jgi:hypothetical protein
MSTRRTSVGSLLITLLVTLFLPSTSFAEQLIHTYSSHIEIKPDGSASVQEEVVYDFGEEVLHGIYRTIPLSVRALGKTDYSSLDIASILVTDGHGKRYDVAYDKGGNVVTLKIGDKAETVTGPQLYVIRYTLFGAVTPNLISDQFDWDVLGADWNAPIGRTRAEILFPNETVTSKIAARCGFITNEGKSEECESGAVYATTTEIGYAIRYEATDTPPHTRFLIQAVFPKGAIIYKKASDTHSDSALRERGIVRWWNRPFIDLSLVVPFLVFFALLSVRLGQGNTPKTKRYVMRKHYLLTALALGIISFFIPEYNLATLCTALVICGFGLVERGIEPK